MIKLILFLCLSLINISATVCDMKTLDANSSNINLYEKAYLDLIADQSNSRFQKAFFLHFPKDFQTLDNYYGNEDLPNGKCRYMVMYEKYGIDAFDRFFKLNAIQKECIYEKNYQCTSRRI